MSPKLFGYLGVSPFVLMAFISLILSSENEMLLMNIINGSVSSFILVFLAGAHWGQAVPTSNSSQYKIAILFSFAVFVAFILSLWLVETSLPLLLFIGLFWAMFFLDKKYLLPEHVPEEYFEFRKKLTIAVSICLFITVIS